ncbi:flagellar export chaperone FliS [Sedimentibacter hydroxybenzoicus DSM 7310]|uniref:Flagellar export chaperone FliS n=1 Tax=Sedimentibacter hydroxybenzoicus DSM 7310 TaxID=1123245 RepID=A0A974BGG7_SEDHY|nr:flagellar export chaperone FliS [Sedimentibacter hydroxybenzoicus]NYB72627.1 flagellar export chaperone FliS [Sedimentibacter hydroxybenzoicus DSM 7310]
MLNPYEQYKINSINTMTKGELLIMIFDELIKKLNRSIVLIENKDFEQSKIQLDKSRKIINHLIVTLDEQYEITPNLTELYMFFNRELIKAAGYNDPKYINEIMPMIKDLRNTWAEADKIAKLSKS